VILLTVGTQLPFDRLVAAMDRIARDLPEAIVAQTGPGRYAPQHMRWQASFEPAAFERLLGEARVIVAHAGIGSVLSAQRHGKGIVLFPRRAALGEHRNDHQQATVAQLDGRRGIYVARTEGELL
jgi:UDP-N-acetylglucosamine transferase subunit ALG13